MELNAKISRMIREDSEMRITIESRAAARAEGRMTPRRVYVGRCDCEMRLN